MVLHISSERVSFWTPPPPSSLLTPPSHAATNTLNDMRNKLRYRPASIKYSRRQRNKVQNAEDRSQHLPTASGLKMNECLLSTVGDWDFNVFNLDKLTNGRSLFHLTLHLFQEHDLINTFKLDIVKLMRCITLIEEGYHASNPYHNATHAADVVQAMHVFLREPRVAARLSPLDRLTALLAAATHDLDHPGVNQAFLIATGNHLAALYNNTSVLENHHWRSAVGVLREVGLLDHLAPETWTLLESHLRSLILATDITRQPEFLNKFKQHMDHNDLDLWQQSERLFLLQIALKCADISNPCRPWNVSKRWSQQVCDEFFKQGDYERKLSLPVTSLCDREATTVAKIQIGFMKFVVEPLFREWQRFNNTALSEQLLSNVASNEQKWEAIEAGEDDADDDIKALIAKVPINAFTSDDDDNDEHDKERADSVDDMRKRENSKSESSKVPPVITVPIVDADEAMTRPHPRRHSMPKVNPMSSGNHIPLTPSGLRRHSLPMVVALSVSGDKLSDKLAMIAECIPAAAATNGNKKLYLESLRTNITQLGQGLDEHAMEQGSAAGSTITSAHGLDQVVLHTRHHHPTSTHHPLPQQHKQLNSNAMMSKSSQGCRSSMLDSMKLHLPNQPLRRASVPYEKTIPAGAADTQPLLINIQQPGEVLMRRHSDVPGPPAISAAAAACYFPTCNSLLPVSRSTSSSAGGNDGATTPLLLASHDSLPSLQV